jgi:hypothetical protein
MEITSPRFPIWIEPEDLELIRASLKRSAVGDAIIASFTGSALHDEFEAWDSVVTADWDGCDFSEYDHDIGCRYFIQLAIEHSSPQSASRLAQAVESLDAKFRARMRPCRERITRVHLELKGHPYFWESNSIHPDQT